MSNASWQPNTPKTKSNVLLIAVCTVAMFVALALAGLTWHLTTWYGILATLFVGGALFCLAKGSYAFQRYAGTSLIGDGVAFIGLFLLLLVLVVVLTWKVVP